MYEQILYCKVDYVDQFHKIIDNWKEMLVKSSLKQRAKDRTEARFITLASQLNARHEKLLGKNCKLQQMTQLKMDQVPIDYENTCQTLETIFNGN